MKALTIIASFLVLSPLVALSGTVVGMLRAFNELATADPETGILAKHITLALYSQAFALFAFPAGMILQGVIARRTGRYSRRVWAFLLVMSALFCLAGRISLVVGGISVVLLFVLEIFKKMRAGGQSGQEIASSG